MNQYLAAKWAANNSQHKRRENVGLSGQCSSQQAGYHPNRLKICRPRKAVYLNQGAHVAAYIQVRSCN